MPLDDARVFNTGYQGLHDTKNGVKVRGGFSIHCPKGCPPAEAMVIVNTFLRDVRDQADAWLEQE